jgi:hypothetical protein
MRMETLQKWKEVATIVSLIAVPVLVAFIPQEIQSHMAEQGARKDYVMLAIGILTKKKDEEPDVELRRWAVDIVDKNSPVKLPDSLKAKLGSGGATIASFPVYFRSGNTEYGAYLALSGGDDQARADLTKAIQDAVKKMDAEKAQKNKEESEKP